MRLRADRPYPGDVAGDSSRRRRGDAGAGTRTARWQSDLDDMEGYTQSPTNTQAVLTFLSAWTTQLHAEGYLSGVYGSADSTIRDLVNAVGTGYPAPDDIWVARWNGLQTTSDPAVPSSYWSGQQRIHQYSGDHYETYGGVSLQIDGDYVDGATADTGGGPPAPALPDGTFVQVAGTAPVYEIAGGAPLFVSNLTLFGNPQVSVITPAQFAALRPYPADGTFLVTTGGGNYRVAGGTPIAISNWRLFGGPPPAVPAVTIDQWDLSNVANPLSHLLAFPVNGTVVQGLPSGAYWSFTGGYRMSALPTPGALTVDDQGLAAFALAPATGGVGAGAPKPHSAGPPCVAPRLKHMSLRRARSALRQAHCLVGRVPPSPPLGPASSAQGVRPVRESAQHTPHELQGQPETAMSESAIRARFR